MQELLRIDVTLDQIETVRGASGEAIMISFHGSFICALGTGRVLPGGVDTQIQKAGENQSVSARYILEGRDRKNKCFRIFVENNGISKTGEQLTTQPIVYTDAEELQWMEKEKLTGVVEGAGENQVQIKIYGRFMDEGRD